MINAYIIPFKSIGNAQNGYLTAYEKNTGVPFKIQRVYTVTKAQCNVERGFHAHKQLEQLFVAISGEIEVMCEDLLGNKETITLSDNQTALYCGIDVWHTLKYKDNAILMVLASAPYDESDYIRDYESFLERRNKK